MQLVSFNTPWKRQKTSGFLMFSVGIKRDQWHEIGYYCEMWTQAYSKVFTARKMNFSIKDFFNKCDQIRNLLRIWSHLLKKSLTENFIYCAVFELFFSHKHNAHVNQTK